MANTAVITGGTGGMGLATAKILGRDHRIVLADLSQERIDAAVAELKAEGIDASGQVCDITDRASIEALFDAAEQGGHVRAVVHTAGISPQMGSAEKVAHINGSGTVNITLAYLARVQEGDALVNVASMSGHQLPGLLIPKGAFRKAETDPAAFEKAIVKRAGIAKKMKSGLAYAISKTFVIWYVRQKAGAFGAKGARIVSVSPGNFDTAMGRLEKDHGGEAMMKTAAIKRFGKPEEIAAALAFAASEAAGYLTGVDILMDGGVITGQQVAKGK
ncbi:MULTISPECIES: SDR family oxidoreductase [unclassified Salinibacterium]|uniref:SDR family oxidoreductase n=1 Tax=unclassified Salinibacterium TaxID=2632331 RepID=UPI001421FD53|nr:MULTISPECIES: SDR family oxidoreductase [unclassified Salinibacterium]